MANEYTISKIKLPNGDVCNLKDTTYSAGTGIEISGTTVSNAGVTSIKGNSESSYRTGQVNLTAANIGAIAINETGNTRQLARPKGLNGVNDVTYQTLINDVRANRLAFLPADQIIIEKTIDGGTTWTDAGYTDDQKQNLFSEKRQTISIPQINGEMNIKCGLRVTITGMKYNVPANTNETQKYNYWNSNYIVSTERHCQIKNMYFWVTSAYNSIKVKVERATGEASTNWVVAFDKDDYGMTGWSGNNIISFSQANFGGGTHQPWNYWNWRFTFMTRGPGGSTTLDNRSLNAVQEISEIRGYGDTWWIKSNEYMASDHLYSWDYNKNATFPAKVTATKFIGALEGNASTATEFSTAKSITLTGDITGTASSTGGWSIATTLGEGKVTNTMLANSSITVGNKTISLGDSGTVHDILYNSTAISTNTSWDIIEPGVYSVISSVEFTGANAPEAANGGLEPYRYGQLIVSRAKNSGLAEFYISHNDSNTNSYGIKFRTGWNNQYKSGTTDSKWKTLLDSGNYIQYTVKKDGTGASGDWNINAVNVTGVVDVTHGGTGASTQEGARANLGLGTMATENADYYPKLYAGTASTSCILTGSFSMSTETWRYYRSDAATTVKSALGTDNSTTNQWLNKKGEWSTPPDTHHTAYLYAGINNGISNATTTTGNTYLNLVENSTFRSGIKLVPGSNMNITSDDSGNVTFSATDQAVSQRNSTTSDWRKLLLGYNHNSSTNITNSDVTDISYTTVGLEVQPSTGTLRANIYRVKDNVELQWNTDDESLDFVFI